MSEEENLSGDEKELGLPNNPTDEPLVKDPDRRSGKDRRSGEDRRKTDDSGNERPERRSGKERRTGKDRRKPSQN